MVFCETSAFLVQFSSVAWTSWTLKPSMASVASLHGQLFLQAVVAIASKPAGGIFHCHACVWAPEARPLGRLEKI